jgi:adenosine deaminase
MARTDSVELNEICLRVLQSETASYAEYRMMFSPFLSPQDYKEKLSTLFSSFQKARKETGRNDKLILSLSRTPAVLDWQWRLVKEMLEQKQIPEDDEFILAGIDFCAQEEGFPPEDKQSFFTDLNQWNETSKHKLSVLYHAGESFTDKTVESAARWVLLAARMGATRIGHGLAAIMEPSFWEGQVVYEIESERRNHVLHLIQEHDQMREFSVLTSTPFPAEYQIPILEAELTNLNTRIEYSREHVAAVRFYQDYVLYELSHLCPVEVCPSSNFIISGMTPSVLNYRRFQTSGVTVVAGSDDRGIFQTDIDRELQKLREIMA